MRALRSLPIVFVLCLGAVSCSGSKAPPEPCTPSGPTQTVELQDFAFAPTCIGAASGTHLTLQNTGATPHTFTINGTPLDQKVEAGAGAEASLDGIAPGTYAVICDYHPQMTATLVVS